MLDASWLPDVRRDLYEHEGECMTHISSGNFEEKPFTLQDYFMSFYKEERDFGGLDGVKGNTKEGLKK